MANRSDPAGHTFKLCPISNPLMPPHVEEAAMLHSTLIILSSATYMYCIKGPINSHASYKSWSIFTMLMPPCGEVTAFSRAKEGDIKGLLASSFGP